MEPSQSGPLVPILRIDQVLGDRVALATWHEALSDSLSTDLPHDLLGLWLYPREGGAVLLGPEALAQDDLAIPLPSPQLQPPQLALIEEIVRDAGYASTACVPVRFGRRDVGLVLVADLRERMYDDEAVALLELVAQRLAPTFGRLARQWNTAQGSQIFQLERVAALLDLVAQVSTGAATPQRLAQALSHGLDPLLPHDRFELLLGDPTGSRYYRLGEHAGGAPWSDPSLLLERESLDLMALANGDGRVVVADVARKRGWPRGYFTVADPGGAELRAVVAARIVGPGRSPIWLLAGSVGPDLYDNNDAELLAKVGALIAPEVTLLVERALLRETPPGRLSPAEPLLEIAQLLALGTDAAEAAREMADRAGRFLPFDELRIALRLSEGDRAVLFAPGERKAIPDLPSLPVAGTGLGQVLAGEVPHLFALVGGEARLIVPLRVQGRVHGALVLTAAPPAVLNPLHLEPAQRLADVIAPHLELLRRAAMLPQPFRPGWKPEHKS
ncbi:MAG: GAF domain-containing protein [Gemmatimonadales bacterium]